MNCQEVRFQWRHVESAGEARCTVLRSATACGCAVIACQNTTLSLGGNPSPVGRDRLRTRYTFASSAALLMNKGALNSMARTEGIAILGSSRETLSEFQLPFDARDASSI